MGHLSGRPARLVGWEVTAHRPGHERERARRVAHTGGLGAGAGSPRVWFGLDSVMLCSFLKL